MKKSLDLIIINTNADVEVEVKPKDEGMSEWNTEGKSILFVFGSSSNLMLQFK